MNTARRSRFAALMVAVVMTATLNGAMLWKFDSVAREATLAQTASAAMLVTLNTVDVIISHTA